MKHSKIFIIGLVLTAGSVAFNLLLRWQPFNQPISVPELHYYGWPLYWLTAYGEDQPIFNIHFAGLAVDYALWTILVYLVLAPQLRRRS